MLTKAGFLRVRRGVRVGRLAAAAAEAVVVCSSVSLVTTMIAGDGRRWLTMVDVANAWTFVSHVPSCMFCPCCTVPWYQPFGLRVAYVLYVHVVYVHWHAIRRSHPRRWRSKRRRKSPNWRLGWPQSRRREATPSNRHLLPSSQPSRLSWLNSPRPESRRRIANQQSSSSAGHRCFLYGGVVWLGVLGYRQTLYLSSQDQRLGGGGPRRFCKNEWYTKPGPVVEGVGAGM
jgi:hypothetical protein